MSLCKRIIELHNGHIGIDKEYSHGCRMVFDIPVDLKSAPLEKKPVERLAPTLWEQFSTSLSVGNERVQ